MARKLMTVAAGQGLRMVLRSACEAVGAKVYSQRLDESSTEVRLVVTYDGGPKELQRALWKEIPGAWIAVREAS